MRTALIDRVLHYADAIAVWGKSYGLGHAEERSATTEEPTTDGKKPRPKK